jgi:hypothetical protein
LTFEAGRWILKTPFALMVILSGMLFDHVLRMLLTMSSQYYRLIELPEALFGVIGSLRSMMGLFIPALALIMARRLAPRTNLFLLAGLTLVGLWGMTFAWPIWGLIPAFFLAGVMNFVVFFVSQYLNRITSGHHRATVLSFKGLSFNVAYGMIGILYSVLLAYLREGETDGLPAAADLADRVFVSSLHWFPWYFAAGLAALLILGAAVRPNSDVPFDAPVVRTPRKEQD